MKGATVVTGAASGIGRAVARALVTAGGAVVALDRDEHGLAALARELPERVVPVVADIADWHAHELAANAAERAGGLDGWVNNAAVDVIGGAHEVDAAHIERALRVLQVGPMFGAAVAVRRMLRRGRGSIVNVSSIQGVVAFPRYYAYEAAKAALRMVSRSIAVDYGPHGLRCNTVLPGVILTPMTESTLPADESRDAALAREALLAPAGLLGTPEEVAAAITWLLSDAASYVNGAEIIVDGGATARCYAYPPLSVPASPATPG